MPVQELHFQSLGAFVLALVLPLLVVSLFLTERRRRKRSVAEAFSGDSKDESRTVSILLLLCAGATIAGSVLTGVSLLGSADDPLKSPMGLTGLSLLAGALLLAALALWLHRELRPVFILPTTSLVQDIPEGRPSRLRFLVPVFRLFSIVLIIVALARPQMASTMADEYTEGMDIVLVLDVSTSMRAVDFAPPDRPRDQMSRIEGAKETIANFIKQRKNDRLGLVIFASEAFTQSPLTLDYSVLQNILNSIDTGVIEDGTAIGNAVVVAVNRLRDSEAESKVIILLTDGDDNASTVAPAQAAEIAAEKNIIVFPILVGKGGRVPYPVGTGMFGQMQYQSVEIRTNPELLQKIAEITKGTFYRAIDQRGLEEDLQDILNHMKTTRLLEPGRFTHTAEEFQLPLLAALVLLLFELLLRWTRFRAFP
jgi:Ca-activated chloride channel family protein